MGAGGKVGCPGWRGEGGTFEPVGAIGFGVMLSPAGDGLVGDFCGYSGMSVRTDPEGDELEGSILLTTLSFPAVFCPAEAHNT